eukprot:12145070-Prorocentrum_lima.AAC.1
MGLGPDWFAVLPQKFFDPVGVGDEAIVVVECPEGLLFAEHVPGIPDVPWQLGRAAYRSARACGMYSAVRRACKLAVSGGPTLRLVRRYPSVRALWAPTMVPQPSVEVPSRHHR